MLYDISAKKNNLCQKENRDFVVQQIFFDNIKGVSARIFLVYHIYGIPGLSGAGVGVGTFL